MTAALITFIIAFCFSLAGTLPPGTLNLTIIQLGLDHKMTLAWRMAIAAALIEYPYAWIAVEFEDFLAQSIEITHSFHLIAAVVMTGLGTLNLRSATTPSRLRQRFDASGFRKGIVLGLLNPLAIPFWMAVTGYLKSYGWIDLSDNLQLHAYLLGVSAGTLIVFMLFAYLARRAGARLNADGFLKKVPGLLLIGLGAYSLGVYIAG